MSFASEVRRFADLTKERQRAVFERSAALAFGSIRDGSPVTGAPGQPVVSSRLKDSWQLKMDADEALIWTTLFYAPWIEHGALSEGKPLDDGPSPGGPHSLKKTVAGFDRLVEQALGQVP